MVSLLLLLLLSADNDVPAVVAVVVTADKELVSIMMALALLGSRFLQRAKYESKTIMYCYDDGE